MTTFFWFRRDLRLDDNSGLYHALRSGRKVQCVFIFDKTILDKLEDKDDARVTFIHVQLTLLSEQLRTLGSQLVILHDTPIRAWKILIEKYSFDSVYINHDYEPYAKKRDDSIKQLLESHGIAFHTFKDQVIFEKNEIVKDKGTPYTVYTPYRNKFMAALQLKKPVIFHCKKHFNNFVKSPAEPVITLNQLGFSYSKKFFPWKKIQDEVINNYDSTRNYPGVSGTSRLGVHLRFGTISIRQLVLKSLESDSKNFINELTWREFYMMILWNFPYVVHHSFRREYDNIEWRNNEHEFELWCKGMTGYPFVDAGMRELEATGFMHNRARMVTASFLTKHLLTDWRWGEAWFARKLLDYELASNNGGWQWAAGSGTDAAPYFRIFNPYEQQRKFDSDGSYIRKWIPELDDITYPQPVVDHKFARERCIRVFRKALNTF